MTAQVSTPTALGTSAVSRRAENRTTEVQRMQWNPPWNVSESPATNLRRHCTAARKLLYWLRKCFPATVARACVSSRRHNRLEG